MVGSWFVGDHTVPHPSSLVAVDQARREINSSLVIIGSSAVQFLQHVHEKTSGREFVDASSPGEASFNYLTLTLGNIRGFSCLFHLYGFGADERLQPMIGDVMAHASALIIAADRDDANTRHAASLVARLGRGLPAVVLAPDASRPAWTRVTGVAPVFEGPMSLDAVFPALKVAAKETLSQLRTTQV